MADIDKWAKEGALRIARGIEMRRRRADVNAVRIPSHIELRPADDWVDPDSGRREHEPTPELVLVGRYFRRSRLYADMSQQTLADKAGVSQSMVSRLERGVAPGMDFHRFVDMCLVVGRLFPIGACPHDHLCAWQPVRPPPDLRVLDGQEFLDRLRQYAGEP